MSELLKRSACLSIILAVVLTISSRADVEERKPPPIPRPMLELKKHGTVDVTRNESGEVESIRLIVTSYRITLDEASKPLEDMHGRKVRVLGTYRKIDDEGWFTVSSVEPLVVDGEKTETEQDKAVEQKTVKDKETPEKPEPVPQKPAEQPEPEPEDSE